MGINKYSYDGPVKEFDMIITRHWIGTTYAISEEKARSNLTYRFKTKNKKSPNTQITLTGKMTVE